MQSLPRHSLCREHVCLFAKLAKGNSVSWKVGLEDPCGSHQAQSCVSSLSLHSMPCILVQGLSVGPAKCCAHMLSRQQRERRPARGSCRQPPSRRPSAAQPWGHTARPQTRKRQVRWSGRPRRLRLEPRAPGTAALRGCCCPWGSASSRQSSAWLRWSWRCRTSVCSVSRQPAPARMLCPAPSGPPAPYMDSSGICNLADSFWGKMHAAL